MLQRLLTPLATLVLLSACATAPEAPDGSAPAGDRTSVTMVTSTEGELGTFLVDGDGRTLYVFTADAPGVSNCDADCLTSWPPLLTDGRPAADGAVDATLLDTLVRVDGSLQVTYAGRPLYFFAADTAAGDSNGQGVNGAWFVIAPDGTMLTAAVDDTLDDGMSPSEGGVY
jgi:predicted lipoprotein with Yx(FWY)xxD motif